jgi:hypothetical protein
MDAGFQRLARGGIETGGERAVAAEEHVEEKEKEEHEAEEKEEEEEEEQPVEA